MNKKGEPSKPGATTARPNAVEKRKTAVGGHRSEVKDAHDRYANIEVSYDR